MSIQIFARGAWSGRLPFSLDPARVYTCIAIRSFREIEAEGMGVFELVYQPVGLDLNTCETDRVNAVSIITLESEGYPNILIPESFIESYPTAVIEGFSRIVMAVEIGVLPDHVPLDYLQAAMQQAVQDIVGVEDAVVELFKAPIMGTLTPEQAELLEANRQALIQAGSNHYAENKRLSDALTLERAKVARLEQIIINNSIPV